MYWSFPGDPVSYLMLIDTVATRRVYVVRTTYDVTVQICTQMTILAHKYAGTSDWTIEKKNQNGVPPKITKRQASVHGSDSYDSSLVLVQGCHCYNKKITSYSNPL